MRISRKESNCAKCPLRDRVRVRTEAPDGPARIVLIGEAPGAREEVEGRPFCGPAGSVLNSVLTEAEIARHNCRVMNVINCRPTDNDIESEEAHEAIVCCAAGFQAELKDAVRKGAKVFMPLGATAQRAMGIEGGITKNRGSVFSTPSKVPAIPTFHPSFILRGMQKEEPTWIADFKKAKDISKRGWKAPEEHFNLFPTLGEVEEFIERAIRKKSLIAVDLETTGLSPDRAEIFVIGLASDGETAISVPFFRHGGGPYWENGDELAVKQLLQKLFSANELLFQNAFFDVSHLRHKGFRVERKIHDALLLHHAIHPELPHNLGYIVSIYGQTPYWKDGVLGRDGSLSSIPDEHLRSYNLRDSVVLHQIYPGLLADGKELGVLPVYHDISAPLVPVLSTAFLRGIRVDQRKLGKYKRSLQSHLEESDAALRDIAQLPPAFNLSSDDHLRKLFYGEDAPQFKRALQEAGQYDLDLRKRRDTKKYKELQDRVEVCSKTVPLWCAPRQKYTKGDRLSVAEDALLSIQIAALGRAEYLRGLKKKDTRAELALIEKTLKFLKVYRDFQETDKLLSTYTSFPVWSDGRVHAWFTIHGTATGRLSSSKPNLQNQPKDVRKVFIAEPGNIFIQADYSNLELRVLAAVSEDAVMLKTFAEGKNIHDENTRALFSIEPDHPDWKTARRACKIYIFGRNYGGGLRGIYERVCKEVPDLPLTFGAFARADRVYRAAHPAYARWVAETQTEVCATHVLRNAFGRIRIFLGTPFEISREGLNFPIQSAAADIMNRAMVGVYADLRKAKMKSDILVQVHDSLLLECPKTERAAVLRILRKNMEQTFTIKKKQYNFPVDIEAGPNWGEMEAVK